MRRGRAGNVHEVGASMLPELTSESILGDDVTYS